ncbi:unnamed protein product [Hymenolepis diminuta]|uniref:Syndecan n=1 Tax=Hymenolepis diminuta TaxID=6216 RepID=A0A0R3S9D5_HYMDI|nr:unnamed protein product [Hymenolepis diminuta]VUZ54036.1 unnamed protein product [Hymenolepis diminuta]
MGAKHSHSTSVPSFDREKIVPTFTTITITTSTRLPPHSKQAVSIMIVASIGSVGLAFLIFILCVYFCKRIGYEAAYSPHEEESRRYHPKGPKGVKV